jgi:hypothetical protein
VRMYLPAHAQEPIPEVRRRSLPTADVEVAVGVGMGIDPRVTPGQARMRSDRLGKPAK